MRSDGDRCGMRRSSRHVWAPPTRCSSSSSFYLVKDAPDASATDQEFVDYYSSGGQRALMLVGLYLMPFAGIAMIWFIVALRMWASFSIRRENALLSNVQLVSGIVFVALFFVAGAASTVVAADVEFSNAEIDPDLARRFPEFSTTVLFVFAFRMAAMFVFTTSASSALPASCRAGSPLPASRLVCSSC